MVKKIRNFSIIAHIDHGKSTLADRLMEITGSVVGRRMRKQMLDDLDVEREHGITIKSRAVTIYHKGYQLNFIDTPGHVDFSYEVSRSLAACEGAILVVDATQGVQAQTLANAYLAVENDLYIIPVLNKIDLPASDPESARAQIESVVGIPADDALEVSAKTGQGVEQILEAIINEIPPPDGKDDLPLQALLVDAWYDSYRGVQMLVRIMNGTVSKGERVKFCSTGYTCEVDRVGSFRPEFVEVDVLTAGDVGVLSAGIKDLSRTKIGDTVTNSDQSCTNVLPGFHEMKSMVFAGLYPVESRSFEDLRQALGKLSLNDAAIHYHPETSQALGFGFRCGFLGLLHMSIVQERLEREFDLDLITTSPAVSYNVHLTGGEVKEISNPDEMPQVQEMDRIEEPMMLVTLITPDDYLGLLLKLCEERRGVQKKMEYIGKKIALLEYRLPLAEIIMDFYDRLKTLSRGYATMDYQFDGFQRGELVKLRIMINGQPLDALSIIVHRDKAYLKGKKLVEKLKKEIPRQLFEVILQASIGQRIVARERIPPIRKNVTAKCYGGDITRKRKLLEKQKEGKKRMKRVGSVEIPQEAFLSILSLDD